MRWHIIKAVSAHMADWGFQTTEQAVNKAGDPAYRVRHCAILAGSHAMAAATSDQKSWKRKGLYVLINGLSHFLIDSVKLPKWLDQVLHLAVAVGSAELLKGPQKS